VRKKGAASARDDHERTGKQARDGAQPDTGTGGRTTVGGHPPSRRQAAVKSPSPERKRAEEQLPSSRREARRARSRAPAKKSQTERRAKPDRTKARKRETKRLAPRAAAKRPKGRSGHHAEAAKRRAGSGTAQGGGAPPKARGMTNVGTGSNARRGPTAGADKARRQRAPVRGDGEAGRKGEKDGRRQSPRARERREPGPNPPRTRRGAQQSGGAPQQSTNQRQRQHRWNVHKLKAGGDRKKQSRTAKGARA